MACLILAFAETNSLCMTLFPQLRHVETSLGDCSLFYDLADHTLWVGGDKISTIAAQHEWLGFGSGDFVEGATAKDVLTDPSGRWYCYNLEGGTADVSLIFECDRKLSDEIKNLQVWNKAGCLLNEPSLLCSCCEFVSGDDDQSLPGGNGGCRGDYHFHGPHQGGREHEVQRQLGFPDG